MSIAMIKEELRGPNLFVVRHLLSPAECEEEIRASEANGYGDAPLTTATGFVVNKQVRNNARVMVDDIAGSQKLWEVIRPFIPEKLHDWVAVGLNERLRYYRYDTAEKFAPHYDGEFNRRNGETSRLTLMIYLNEGFEGGETNFFSDQGRLRFGVKPESGMALVFPHLLLHEGAPVKSGRKYVLRTDVMYRTASQS